MNTLNGYYYRCRQNKLVPFHLLSQLDLARFWDRMIRRADIPIAFSKGFNPRPRLSYGPATPTGVVSYAEYVDMVLIKSYEAEYLKNWLNQQIPEEMRVVEVVPIEPKSPSIINSLVGIKYDYFFNGINLPENDLSQIDIEDIEVLDKEIQFNQQFMVSFLFKGKNILMNPYKLIDMLPAPLKLKWGSPVTIIKLEYIW